jgi:hypothetical protein
MDMCKPADSNALGYQRVSDEIVSLVGEAAENTLSGGSFWTLENAVGHSSPQMISSHTGVASALLSPSNVMSARSSSNN